MTYDDFKTQPSSEKITLATLDASKRLMGWVLHSGTVYKLTQFDVSVISSIEDSGVALTSVDSLDEVASGTYFNDRDNSTLYLNASSGANPNGRFIVLTYKLFFSTAPVSLPHDLDEGFEVYWEPGIQSTSQFGVEIDTVNQLGEAIEGKGQLALYNDQDFWPRNFDKLFFENQSCRIYSYSRGLAASEAKLLFRGLVEKKAYSSTRVTFYLKDQLSQLRDAIPLSDLESLGERVSTDLYRAKQRMLFGRVFGHRPVNIDQLLDGYPLTGTISVTNNSATVTGTGTDFLTEVSPDDRVSFGGEEYTVATVDSDTSLTLTDNYLGVDSSGIGINIIPDEPKRYINRRWKVAGHALREPVTATTGGTTVNQLYLESTRDIYPGDVVYVGELGSGTLVTIDDVLNDTTCTLSTSLATIPPIGTVVRRPAIQNVRINDLDLVYYRDYEFDASTSVLTLRDTAEGNAAPIREMLTSITFDLGNRVVTGTGFESYLRPGSLLRVKGQSAFVEVLSVDSDTQVTLRDAAPYDATGNGQYKDVIFDPSEYVLSCDCLGRTEDGTTTGTLLKRGPEIVRRLLRDAGLNDIIDSTTFNDAQDIAYQDLSLVIPSTFQSDETLTYRQVINRVNQSIFGALIQDNDFNLVYTIIEPKKPASSLRLRESDVLDFDIQSTNENMIYRAVVEYKNKEYDYTLGRDGASYETKTSDIAQRIIGTSREKLFQTLLVEERDARVLANRWSFLLEYATNTVRIKTKLQAIDLDINDVVDIEHRKMFERFGGTNRRKIVAVERIVKSGDSVTIEAVDLSNAFNRVAIISDGQTDYADDSEETRLYSGYITDEYGMIDNDPDTFGSNVIW